MKCTKNCGIIQKCSYVKNNCSLQINFVGDFEILNKMGSFTEKAGKNMDNQMRREKLYEMLENAEEPLTGVVLSKALNVTRQIIVGDVALLRSSGKKIISTARGYQLAGEVPEKGFHQEFRCQSRKMDAAELEAELNVVVDNGGIVHGLTLTHEVYGVIQVPMDLYSRREVRQYMERLKEEKGPLITTLTQGRHVLQVEARNDEDLEALGEGLKEMGVLE